MKKIRAKLNGREYFLLYQKGLLKKAGFWVKKYAPADYYVIITNSIVKKHFGKIISDSFKKENLNFKWLLISDYEKHKNLNIINRLYNSLARLGVSKNSAIIALGGGVIQDICNYTAATFRRGVNFVQIPTTLVAQADIGFSGCAINHPMGKSLIGTFYQPKLAITDVSLIKTLPRKHIYNGIAEIINKVGCLSKGKFGQLEKDIKKIVDLDWNVVEKYVILSNKIKLSIIQKDEIKAKGGECALIFGHTFAHAIEKLSNYKITHGEAVGIGTYAEALLSQKSNFLHLNKVLRLKKLIKGCKLSVFIPKNISKEKLLLSIIQDKKDTANFVLLKNFGQYYYKEINRKTLEEVIESL